MQSKWARSYTYCSMAHRTLKKTVWYFIFCTNTFSKDIMESWYDVSAMVRPLKVFTFIKYLVSRVNAYCGKYMLLLWNTNSFNPMHYLNSLYQNANRSVNFNSLHTLHFNIPVLNMTRSISSFCIIQCFGHGKQLPHINIFNKKLSYK
jgi:hypothetical protein